MSSKQEFIKKLSKQLIGGMIKEDVDEWPPKCMLLAYQPIRPNTDGKQSYHESINAIKK